MICHALLPACRCCQAMDRLTPDGAFTSAWNAVLPPGNTPTFRGGFVIVMTLSEAVQTDIGLE